MGITNTAIYQSGLTIENYFKIHKNIFYAKIKVATDSFNEHKLKAFFFAEI